MPLGLMPGEHDWWEKFGGGLLGQPENNGIFGALQHPVAQLGLNILANNRGQGLGQNFGQAGLATLAQQQERGQSDLQRRLIEAQIKNYNEPNRGAPSSVQEYEYAVKTSGFKGSYADWLKTTGGSNRPAAVEEYEYYQNLLGKDPAKAKEFLTLKRQPTAPQLSIINGVPTLVDRFAATQTPLSTLTSEQDAARGIKGAEAAGKAESERYSTQVDTGLDAADSLATVKRGVELLQEIPTGGFDAVKLKATNLFGITGANEAELSANLGKAVLSQLRATFGAQFTEKEGARLAEIEAGFGKSTEGNKRLLQQAQKILERAARRGMHAAEKLGDEFTAKEIRDAMEFSLSPNASKPPGGAAPAKKRIRVDAQGNVIGN